MKIKIYNLLYRCATWFLTLREEHRLRMSAKRVLGTTSGPNRMRGGRIIKIIVGNT
jgi:hypothetical protein